MNQNFEFDDATQGIDYAGLGADMSGAVTTIRRVTVEDVLYRVATVSAVLFLLITML